MNSRLKTGERETKVHFPFLLAVHLSSVWDKQYKNKEVEEETNYNGGDK